MYRLSLAVAVTAALMSLGTKANAFVVANGTFLDGVSPSIDIESMTLEASAGNSVRGANTLDRQEMQGTSPSGHEEDAHRAAAGARHRRVLITSAVLLCRLLYPANGEQKIRASRRRAHPFLWSAISSTFY